MAQVDKGLYGCWKMTAMRFKTEEGGWENEEVCGGTSIFTESGVVNTFTRTSELAFGYSGTFVLDGNDMLVTPDVCSIPELEGKRMVRTVKKLTHENLTLGMHDEATGRLYEIDFKLVSPTFGH